MSPNTRNETQTIVLPFGQITPWNEKDRVGYADIEPVPERRADDGLDLDCAEFEFSDPRP